MFGWLRKRRAARPIPDEMWQAVLARHPFLAQRPQAELQRLRELAAQFLATKEFHGANGFVITDAVALAIAAQAVLPVLNLGLGWYDDFVGIVVHPDEVLARRTVTDHDGVVHHYDEVLAGEAMDGGPVMLSWSDVDSAGASAERGYNVVIHEFIHKIDMRDGAPDGCPPLRSKAARQAWLAVMQAEYDAFREKVIIAERFGGEEPWLDAYGATGIDEFFAVACEAYFVNRHRFETEFPALLPLLDGFFGLSSSAAAGS
ncbi:M90 family metallopeptidase [Caenimonas soli]|uniref:M90 family metallopeptidase n=1 Tax=Caenimonas soli TaxID=2735555 RepID=UPI001556147A|nr:M90 family metallopeptidase [Caenimonas soli]NPC56705.1 zinc-dependent peptidase [Caenimonas soli]